MSVLNFQHKVITQSHDNFCYLLAMSTSILEGSCYIQLLNVNFGQEAILIYGLN